MYYSLIILLFIQFCNSEYFSVSKSTIFSITENDKSYFGYSLQLQVNSNNEELGRIIVGAPKANSTINKKYYENGVVYSCSITTKKCEEIPLEENEEQLNNIGLGSALDAEESEDGFIVACAPRWRDTIHNSTKGMCFSQKNTVLDKLYPLKNTSLNKHGLYYSQFGQVGFSAHLIKNQEHSLILGSPGIYSWTGTLAQYSSLDRKEDSIIATPYREDNKIDTYSYFGYSTFAGKFNASNLNQIFYVSGAPRNKDLYGSVNVFDPIKNEPFRNRYMFTGTQFGEYFGASVTVGKLDADNLDDIIIGAPTYSIDNEDDVGCIYVFQADKNEKMLSFKKYRKIVGDQRGSKFGYALSYLGDINGDGFGDIAVGAPYYDNRGAVYIYFGNNDGLTQDYKQKILASYIDKSLRGFGCSLSRGLDVDHNTNNDLAVGAYISGHVVLLTSRPIVKIKTNMKLEEGMQLNINTTYLIIKYCLTYKADIRLPSNNINLIFSILNTNKVTFENKNNKWTHTINMKGNTETCDTFKIFNNQVFNDILLQMDYVILSTSSEEKFKPLEEQHSPTILPIHFNKGCSSKICQPNLKLTTFLKNMEKTWIIGTPENLELLVILENTAEPSYTNKLVMQVIPEYLKFSLYPNYCDHSNNVIICNFKYPILTNEIKKITFELDATKLDVDDTKMIFNATIISDKDTDATDNTNIFEVPLKSDVNFKILTKSQPDEITNLTDIQTLNHQYSIENIGVTDVKKLKLNLLIPYEVKQTEFLVSVIVTGCSGNHIPEKSISTNNENNGLVLDIPTDNSLFINCTSLKEDHVKCQKIECEILNSLSSFSINITMMINSNLIGELHKEGPIILSTTLEPDFRFISTYSHIWTKLVNKPQAASITKYLIIGILVSLLLVFILIFILYKCGFFTKRKLPDKTDHEQLLNGVLETKEPQS